MARQPLGPSAVGLGFAVCLLYTTLLVFSVNMSIVTQVQ